MTPKTHHAKMGGGGGGALLSVPTVSRAVCNRMIDGQWTRKRLARGTMDKFSPVNVNYCQIFLNFMSNVDPHSLKVFHECGICTS